MFGCSFWWGLLWKSKRGKLTWWWDTIDAGCNLVGLEGLGGDEIGFGGEQSSESNKILLKVEDLKNEENLFQSTQNHQLLCFASDLQQL